MFCYSGVGDAVAEDEVVGEIETDKVRSLYLMYHRNYYILLNLEVQVNENADLLKQI